jgi:O-antigen/teichoic acid export membrane protein
VVGQCCLALLAVSCAILNAAGRALSALGLMAVTLTTGIVTAFVLVPRASLGPDMLVAAATAASVGMVLGFVLSVGYVRLRLGGNAPLGTVARVIVATAAAVLVGRVLPGHGRIIGLGITFVVAVVYFVSLAVLGEFGPQDRAKVRKILRRA